MSVIDAHSVSDWAQMIIAIVSVVIGLISLRSFLIVRSPSSLIIAIAFFLLAYPPSLHILSALGLYQWPDPNSFTPDYITQMIHLWDDTSVCQLLAFGLLAMMYLDQLKDKSVQFGRLQLDLLAAILALVVIYAAYTFEYNIGSEFGHPFLPMLSAVVSVVLLLVFLTVMYSFYRARKDRFTLMGMSGFLLILFNAAFTLIEFDRDSWNGINNVTGGWGIALALIVSLIGYIVFLTAIIRTRLSHE